VGANVITTGTLKDVATAKIGDKFDSYHMEDGMIGGKLGSYEKVKRMTPEAERSSGTTFVDSSR
jgi:hypothetical protein